jgi:hypothetical protein
MGDNGHTRTLVSGRFGDRSPCRGWPHRSPDRIIGRLLVRLQATRLLARFPQTGAGRASAGESYPRPPGVSNLPRLLYPTTRT